MNVLNYLIQVSVALVLFYVLYFLFLKKETFFQTNRWFLLFSAILSFILPVLSIDIHWGNPVHLPVYKGILNEIVISQGQNSASVPIHSMPGKILLSIYLGGVFCLLLRLAFHFFQIFQLYRKSEIVKNYGVIIVLVPTDIMSFSFHRMIFIPKRIYDMDDYDEIVEHELVHVRQGHSIDSILLEFMTIVLWFNPFIWLLRKSLKGIHEYLADQGVLRAGFDPGLYQNRLVSEIIGLPVNDLIANFNYLLIKERLQMMKRKQSKNVNRLKCLLAIPLSMLLLLSFAPSKAITDVKAALQTDKQDQQKILTSKQVDEIPKYQESSFEKFRYLVQTRVKYPENCVKEGRSGETIATFTVNEQGKMEDLKIKQSVHPDFDKEVLRVLNTFKKEWTPALKDGKAVKVRLTLPVKFKLQ